MFDLSPIQLILVLIIALVAIGPRRLPEVGRTIGRTLREVRGVMSLEGDDGRPQQPGPANGGGPASPDRTDGPATSSRPVAVGGERRPADGETNTDVDQAAGQAARPAHPEDAPVRADDLVVRGPRAR